MPVAAHNRDSDTRSPTPVLIFDGDCGFCTTTARWIERRLPDRVAVEPWQALDLDALRLTEHDVTTAAWWVDTEGNRYRGHMAIAKALAAAGGIWRPIGLVMGVPPMSWLARPIYWLIARYRYKLPGSTDACRLPQG